MAVEDFFTCILPKIRLQEAVCSKWKDAVVVSQLRSMLFESFDVLAAADSQQGRPEAEWPEALVEAHAKLTLTVRLSHSDAPDVDQIQCISASSMLSLPPPCLQLLLSKPLTPPGAGTVPISQSPFPHGPVLGLLRGALSTA